MSSVIFLDCDGVLCNARSQRYDFVSGDNTLIHHLDIPPLEKRCIYALERIVQETGAEIVLTTTWRRVPEYRNFLVESLQAAGCNVLGDTPDLGSAGRGAEVAAWLQDHKEVTHFVALEDDDKHVASFQKVLPAGTWVQTTMQNNTDPLSEGITEEKATTAINILKAGEAEQIRQRRKFDPATGDFLRFPGVSVVANIRGSGDGGMGQLPGLIRTMPIVGRFFSPLPATSYHVTVLDVHCQYRLGLNDKAHGDLLRGPQWAKAAQDIVSAACVPRLRPKFGGLIVTSSVIGVELIHVGDDTPAMPKDLPLGQKLSHDLSCKPQEHCWHFTLAYCNRPVDFAAEVDDDFSIALEAERSSLEAAVLAACPSDAAALPMEPARLCRFEDMTAFIPWDGFVP